MRASWNVLRELIDLSEHTPESVAHLMTMAGLEVEGIERFGDLPEKLIVGQVKALSPHPDADKLQVARVDDGEKTHTIVCGASNIHEGAFVATALPGAELPNGLVIKEAKVRGVESAGMLCSEAELQLTEENAGIMLLQEIQPSIDWASMLGQPVREVLGLEDVIFEIGITPNRPDALCHTGIANEIAALLKMDHAEKSVDLLAQAGGSQVAVAIESPDMSHVYTATYIQDALKRPTDLLTRILLSRLGVRSINPIVDVSNLHMLMYGVPTHAFDASKLAKSDAGTISIFVRFARDGETLVTLDGTERKLVATDLIIADAEKPIALAGVMGGANTEVDDNTSDVVLESAHFNASFVRRTARHHGINSEASYRYERGVSPEAVHVQAARIATHLSEAADSLVLSEASGTAFKRAEVVLTASRLHKLSGHTDSGYFMNGLSHLRRLGFAVLDEGAGQALIGIPGTRPDVTREVDLIEEVMRIEGYDVIEASIPKMRPVLDPNKMATLRKQHIRSILSSRGYHEAVHLAFDSDVRAQMVTPEVKPVSIQNPLGEQTNIMRTSLFSAALDAVVRNSSHQAPSMRLFECGTVFWSRVASTAVGQGPDGSDAYAGEEERMLIMSTGSISETGIGGRIAEESALKLKGDLEQLFSALHIPVMFQNADEAPQRYHPRQCAEIIHAETGSVMGHVGSVHPAVLELFGLEQDVFCAEIKLETLMGRVDAERVKELSPYPIVEKDFAFWVDAGTPISAFEETLRGIQSESKNLESWRFFDVYQGEHAPAGKKSVGFACQFVSHEHTLTDEEIVGLISHIKTGVEGHLNANLRDA